MISSKSWRRRRRRTQHGQAAFIHTGLGYGQMYHVGLVENKDCKKGSESRNWFAVRPEVHGDLIFRLNSGCMKGEPNAFKDNPFMGTWLKSADRAACAHKCWFIHLPGMATTTAEPEMNWWDILDCNLSANALVVGARAGARPGQVFDFILGWFTVDFTGDDTMAGVVGQPSKK